jgi:hypothetical protein
VESKSDILKRAFNKKNAKRKDWLPLEDEWIKLKARLIMLEWELEAIPVFHPEDSILAIRVEGDPFKLRPPQGQYYAMVRSTAEMKSSDGRQFTEGELVQKEIAYTWLQDNLDEKHLDMLNNHHQEKGWLLFGGGENYTVPLNKDLNRELTKKSIKAFYEYKGDDKDQSPIWL